MSVCNVFRFFEVFEINKSIRAKVCSILEKLDFSSFSDEDVIDVANKIVLIGRENNFDFTKAELFEYLEQNSKSLTNRDLEKVFGGFGRKTIGASLSAIAILSLGTGAIKFFNRNDNNRVFSERSSVSLKNGHDSENEDFYEMVNENKKYKGGKNNWGDLLKEYTKDHLNDFNKDFYKVPSFNRNMPQNKDNSTIKRPNDLPNIKLKKPNSSFSNLKDDNLKADSNNNQYLNTSNDVKNVKLDKKISNNSSDSKKREDVKSIDLGNKDIDDAESFSLSKSNNNVLKGKKQIVSESDSYINVILKQIYYKSTLKNYIINSDSKVEMIKLLKNLFLKYDSNSDVSEEISEFKELLKDKVDLYKFNLSEMYQDIMDELEKGGIHSKFRVAMEPSEQNNDELREDEILDNESLLGFDIEKVRDKKSLNKCFDEDGLFSDDLGNKHKINEYPDSLPIYLNRFKISDNIDNNFEKLDDSFEISSDININKHEYKLKTVIVNIGKAKEGKYILYFYDNGSWKRLNESKIESVRFDDIKDEIDKNAVMVTYDMVKRA